MIDLKTYLRLIVLTASSFIVSQHALAASMDTAIKKGEKRASIAKSQQAKIDQVDSQTKLSEREYRAIVKEVEGLNVYVSQLNKQLVAQQSELHDIEYSIKQVTLIERQITPLMLKMINSLDQFVGADLPFQKDERVKRVENLKELMGRSDVSVAEKYRKVMDAYQKEMNYGRTIKTYRSTIEVAGIIREVDFLRVGRIALLYQSLDSEKLGVWNQASQSFDALDSSYKSNVNQALRIAREQAAPDLIKVPLSAPIAGSPDIISLQMTHSIIK